MVTLLYKLFNRYYRKLIQHAINSDIIKLKAGVKILNLLKYNKFICEICYQEISPFNTKKGHKRVGTIDHIIPKSRGGKNSLINLRLAHYECNQKRGNKLDEDIRTI